MKRFYKASYWNPLIMNAVHLQCVAEQLDDHGVNAGTSRPARILQHVYTTEFTRIL
ncbi:hypothetical protein [uncultured Hymenobacter sp.]|uniref:hypothetical protein n=1 Tax=uncultured Hymenobacter sp. TaxID=170016 RepID=UPI0035CC5C1A